MADKDEQFIFAQVKGFNADGELEAIASTGTIDRDNEIIQPEAWQGSLEGYRRNPVILATHMHRLATGDSPVIGSASQIAVAEDGLTFRLRFAGTELGRQYKQLYEEEHMRAFSVGFIPINGQWQDFNRQGKPKRVYVHSEVELLEISAVPVPANPEALARMRAAMANSTAADQLETKLAAIKADVAAEVVSQFKAAGFDQAAIENLKSEMSDQIKAAVAAIADKVDELIEMHVLSSDTLGQAPPQDGPDADEKATPADEGDKGAELVESIRQGAKELVDASKSNQQGDQ